MYVEAEALFPPFDATWLPHYIGSSDAMFGFHGDKSKILGYIIANTPVTVDKDGTTLNFSGVVRKNADVNSRQMLQSWRLSYDAEDPQQREESNASGDENRSNRQSRETARDERNRQIVQEEERLAEARQRHQRVAAAQDNQGSQRAQRRQRRAQRLRARPRGAADEYRSGFAFVRPDSAQDTAPVVDGQKVLLYHRQLQRYVRRSDTRLMADADQSRATQFVIARVD